MYRPTVRMDDVFKDWIEKLVKETGLDRAQIIRLSIYSAPFSEVFQEQINKRRHGDVNLPPTAWERDSDGDLWRCSIWNNKEREGDVSGINETGKGVSEKFSHQVERRTESDVREKTRRERAVCQPKIFKPGSNQKTGIKINFG